ncbi:MAG: TIGR03960 family B12-binding radical SAM protein [Thermodesulfobacteriota bacterium]|nr:TIGR03960 family B12-binding radical SAM protein [Thermodesulfobacteriota bacterium]
MSWKLKKKQRDILSREEGYQKKVWGDRINVCLAYPNYYRTGMSNLGFQTLYALFNSHPSFLCERVFLPDPDDEAKFILKPTPLFSLESQKSLADFDIIAFSISFENDYPNILKILDMSRITLLSHQRREEEPLIVGGGISVTLNPEPLTDFFDLFMLGEGEEVLPEFLDIFKESHYLDLSKDEMLRRMQKEIEGTYVPKFYSVSYNKDGLIEVFEPTDPSFPKRIKKRSVRNINAFNTDQSIITPDTEFGDMFLTEVSRGCRRGCRFCAAGFAYRPARFRKPKILEQSITEGLEKQKKIGLLGTAVSDHPDLVSLCRSILKKNGKISIGSLRLDRLNKEMVGLLRETGVEMVSLAPEAGSQRLRNVINKGITESHIFDSVELLIENGILNIRLYFMVGLPTESPEDIEAIIDLAKKIKYHAIKHTAGKKKFRKITLSINQFIPKPATPFQWQSLEDANLVRRRIRKIASSLRKETSIKVIHDLPKWNYIQTLLSLGDRSVGKVLLSVHKNKGNWSRALKEVNINPDFYVYRQKDTDEILPWDFIDHGISRKFLIREYQKALSTK